MAESLISGILDNDHIAVSRAISLIERGEAVSRTFYSNLYSHTNKAVRIGITGPPGSGKSTIINEMIDCILEACQ